MMTRFILAVCLAVVFSRFPRTVLASQVLVVGQDSDNVIRFDLNTGAWQEAVHLSERSHPRGIAINDRGDIFLGLEGSSKNIIKIPYDSPREARDLTLPPPGFGGGSEIRGADTRRIGRYGPGAMVFAEGRLWVAGDTERTVYEVNPETGVVSKVPGFTDHFNLVGLTEDKKTLFVGEYFQRSIVRYDLGAKDSNATRLVSRDPHLNRPVGLTIGHDGNLFVANALEPTVVEFDIKTGQYIRTFVDLGVAGKTGIRGLVYAPDVHRYYLASGSDVYEVDTDGRIVAAYNSPSLKKAYGIVLVPDQASNYNRTNKWVSQALASQPAITTLKMTAAGHLQVHGKSGEHYQVLATTDFETWRPIATVENPGGTVDFIDPEASKFDKRFYRIELLPSK